MMVLFARQSRLYLLCLSFLPSFLFPPPFLSLPSFSPFLSLCLASSLPARPLPQPLTVSPTHKPSLPRSTIISSLCSSPITEERRGLRSCSIFYRVSNFRSYASRLFVIIVTDRLTIQNIDANREAACFDRSFCSHYPENVIAKTKREIFSEARFFDSISNIFELFETIPLRTRKSASINFIERIYSLRYIRFSGRTRVSISFLSKLVRL